MADEKFLIAGRSQKRTIVRIGRGTLSFSTISDNVIQFNQYNVKPGMSMAANLRVAIKEGKWIDNGNEGTIMVDGDVLLVPMDSYAEDWAQEMYMHCFPKRKGDVVLHNALPDMGVVVLFGLNKDLRMVVTNNMPGAKFIAAMTPVWTHLYYKSYNGQRQKLFAYFHENRMDIFAFGNKRFKFCNSFAVTEVSDSLYFLLYVWREMGLNQEDDELNIIGNIPQKERLMEELGTYIKRCFVINPTTDFNRATVTAIEEMPYDLMAYYVKSR